MNVMINNFCYGRKLKKESIIFNEYYINKNVHCRYGSIYTVRIETVLQRDVVSCLERIGKEKEKKNIPCALYNWLVSFPSFYFVLLAVIDLFENGEHDKYTIDYYCLLSIISFRFPRLFIFYITISYLIVICSDIYISSSFLPKLNYSIRWSTPFYFLIMFLCRVPQGAGRGRIGIEPHQYIFIQSQTD
jgi:hypothetical protein